MAACEASAGFARIYLDSVGLVAQLVEQRIENPRVGGSIPPQATKKFLSADKHLVRTAATKVVAVLRF